MQEDDTHIRALNDIFLSSYVYNLNIPPASVFVFNLTNHKEELYLYEET
jgi:hypothetical protein